MYLFSNDAQDGRILRFQPSDSLGASLKASLA
jgi:hypothetical protein